MVVVERRVVGRVEDGEVMPVVVGLNDDWTKVEGGSNGGKKWIGRG